MFGGGEVSSSISGLAANNIGNRYSCNVFPPFGHFRQDGKSFFSLPGAEWQHAKKAIGVA